MLRVRSRTILLAPLLFRARRPPLLMPGWRCASNLKNSFSAPLCGTPLLQSVEARGAQIRPRYEFKRVDLGGGNWDVSFFLL